MQSTRINYIKKYNDFETGRNHNNRRIRCFMVNMKQYRAGYFSLGILFIISSINIFSQDNTNNKMTERTETDNLKGMIQQNANYYTNDLKTKLNLTESQAQHIYYILYNYYTNETGNERTQRAALRESKETLNKGTEVSSTEENSLKGASSDANNKIENILDSEQRNSWKGINDTWWTNVKTELFSGDQKLTNNNIYEDRGTNDEERDYENYDVYYPGYDFK
jgi:hypothetical protein